MLYIGVDLGTSAVKLLLMNGNGKIIKTLSKSYPVNFPQSGWSEQDPTDWVINSVDGINKILKGQNRSEVAGISFGGQMHGLVAVDKNGDVIRPAILWNDGRSEEESMYLNNEIGRDKLSEYTGNISFAGFTAPKVLWLKKNEPSNFEKIYKILLPKDYLAYKFCGEFVTDVSDASGTLYFDCRNRIWSNPMLSILGITEDMLPAVHESYEVVGTLLPEICERTGLDASCKIIIGAGDNAAAAIGTSTILDGDCNISLGTSGTIFIASDKFVTDSNNSLHAFDHANGMYHLMGCMLSAASCNKWWCDNIIRTYDYEGQQKNIKTLGDNDVYFLPYLMGERSPINDSRARAAFIGMSMDTKREDMMQAVLEGVCFALKDSFEACRAMGVEIKSASVCGGGAKSPLWRKILSNVLDIELTRTENDEGPALGAAILASVGCGEYSSVEQACKAIVSKTVTETPDIELVDKYKNRYETFKKIYPAIKGGGIW